jgi:5-formyltetrahydrofolate cyclo-ligase
MMDKQQVRKQGLCKLTELAKNKHQKATIEQAIYQDFFADELFIKAQTIGVVLSSSFELNTSPLMEKARSLGKTIVTPRCFKDHQMDFYVTTTTTPLTKTKFGVLEPVSEALMPPEAIDLLIVPGVAFRKDGYRVGFGGGFYDRYLKRFPGKACSLVLPQQIRDDFQPDEFDVAVPKIFTLKGA